MYKRVEQTFYILASFVLLATMFAIRPAGSEETLQFQSTLQAEVVSVWTDVTQGLSPLGDLEFVWNGVNEFYSQAADQTMLVLTPTPTPPQVAITIDQFVAAFDFSPIEANILSLVQTIQAQPIEEVYAINSFADFGEGHDFYQMEYDASISLEVTEVSTGIVAGEVIELDTASFDAQSLSAPVNGADQPWVTLTDSQTGQKYCVAVYNDEVNKYLGECKYDGYY